jgi:hypothetical protein
MLSAKNKSERQLFPKVAITNPTVITEIVLQVTSYRKVFEVGCLPLIRGKISTSPMNRSTAGRGHGSLKVTRSRNGKNPDRVHYYGSMGNVGHHPALTLSQRLMVFPFLAGAGKSVLWCVEPSIFPS